MIDYSETHILLSLNLVKLNIYCDRFVIIIIKLETILKVFIHMFWGRYVVYNSLVYNDQLTKLWPWGMPENRRIPQTTPGLSGKLQDTPQNTAVLAAKPQNNTVCVFFVLTF